VLLLAALNMPGSWAQLVMGAGMAIVASWDSAYARTFCFDETRNALDASVSCYAAPGPAAARRC
jgi:hypothetical protein